MENQLEQQMESEMGTLGPIPGGIYIYICVYI